MAHAWHVRSDVMEGAADSYVPGAQVRATDTHDVSVWFAAATKVRPDVHEAHARSVLEVGDATEYAPAWQRDASTHTVLFARS